MPTDVQGGGSTSVFLLAHQDDEFGVFHAIESERRLGRRVVCVFLTSGVRAGMNPAQRDAESRGVLSALGVEEVIFAGAQLGIEDGKLHMALPHAGRWLDRFLASQPRLTAIHVPAWEGGHPDHDCLHALAVELSQDQNRQRLVRQFSLYNGRGCPGPLFHVLRPLDENGAIQCERIPVGRRIHYLRLLLRYRSQIKTWIGLLPLVVFHYVARGTQELQEVKTTRLAQRPHEGRLYYEKRGFASWEDVDAAVAAWRSLRPHSGTSSVSSGN